MKLIPLSQGMFAQVDDWNYDWLNQWKWCAHKGGKTYYANRTTSRKDGPQKTIQMHRVIMNTPPELEVDHQDHNGLNCLEDNMRNCTRKQNMGNQRTYSNPTGYKGVYEYPGQTYKGKTYRNRIIAGIRVNGKVIWLGSFFTKEDAARAYNKAGIKYFGEFANLNIIK